MVIIKILSQIRRDFTALMECESCGHQQVDPCGYDDANYHNNVVPEIKCHYCGESTKSADLPINPRTPKYPEGLQI